MEFVFSVFAYVSAHQAELVTAVLAAHAAAVAIVNLTPTPKDDAIVAKAYRVVEFAAGLVSKKAKA